MIAAVAQAFNMHDPLAVLAMRADVAVRLMLAQSELNAIRQGMSRCEQPDAKRYEEGPGGTRMYSFNSLSELGQMMGRS